MTPNNKLSTLVQLSSVDLHFGQKLILESVTFSIKEKEVVGIVGRNGSGKSSFLKLISGDLEVDNGKIEFKSNIQVSYVAQDNFLNQEISGGEQKKLAILKAIEQKPDILILDEPTNHLDIESIINLEKTIKNFPGSVLVVSHDRYFLDNITSRLVELNNGKIYSHLGNYQSYVDSKLIRTEIESTQESRRLAFVKRESNWVRAGVKARATKDKGRLDRFYAVENQNKIIKEVKLDLLLPEITPLSNKIINLENITLGIANKIILKDFSFSFQPKTRLGIVGPNGSGKTTFIKALLGKVEPTQGKIVIGYNTLFNYQDQEKLNLDLEKTPMQEIADDLETTNFGDGKISTRKYLKRFLFSSNQMQTKIANFSGGEKARLLLAKILKEGGNCLVLDEPTNDLDLETIQVLEDSLKDFKGVAIIVSHDRYFLNRICNQMLSLDGDGKYTLATGNYDSMISKKSLIVDLTPLEKSELETTIDGTNQKPLKTSNKQIRENLKKLKILEKQIETLESEIKNLELTFTSTEFYTKKPDKINQQIKKHEELKLKLETLMLEWEKSIL